MTDALSKKMHIHFQNQNAKKKKKKAFSGVREAIPDNGRP